MENLRRVRIKSWKEMEKEFGLTSLGDIDIPMRWTPKMEEIIPEDRIIEVDVNLFWIEDENYYFGISNEMIAEYVSEPTEICENTSAEIAPLTKTEKVEIKTQDEINKEFLNGISENNHSIHYIKWDITSNLSIRYFYNFQDRLEFVGKFAIKNHKEKELILISKETATEFISLYNSKFKEIIGYSQKGKNKGYRKIIMQNSKISEIFESFNDKIVK